MLERSLDSGSGGFKKPVEEWVEGLEFFKCKWAH